MMHVTAYCSNFMEKRIALNTANIVVSLWDLGGDSAFASMLPMCVVDAAAILFMFDLTSLPSLHSVKEWYRQVRGLNKMALPVLVGTKFDLFLGLTQEAQQSTLDTARKYAKAMKVGWVFGISDWSAGPCADPTHSRLVDRQLALGLALHEASCSAIAHSRVLHAACARPGIAPCLTPPACPSATLPSLPPLSPAGTPHLLLCLSRG